jgi:hypothetical protein
VDNLKITHDDELSFKELILKMKEWFYYFKSNSFKLLLVGIIGAAVGLGFSILQKPIYTANVSFALEDEKSGGGGGLSGALGLATSLGLDLGTSAGGAFTGGNLIELMKSRTLVEKSLLNNVLVNGKSISLADFYLEFSKLGDDVRDNESLSKISYKAEEPRSNYTVQKDSLLGIIYLKIAGENGFLSVGQKDKKISIINVEVKTENEIFSKSLAESLVKEVSEFYIITKSKKARNNVGILQKQADSIRNELNSAIAGVAITSDNTFNLNPAMNIMRTPTSKRQVDIQANTAILTQLVTNLEMAKVTLLKETPLVQIIDKPILPLKKEAVGKFKGIVIGAILSAFLMFVYLTFKKIIDGLFANSN